MAESDNRRSPRWLIILILGTLALSFMGCLVVVGYGVRLLMKGRDALVADTESTSDLTATTAWPKVPPNGKPLVILIHSVSVTETKADGKPWDKFDQRLGKPDLYVRVTIFDKTLEAERATIHAELNDPKRPRKELDPERKKSLELRHAAIHAQLVYETWTVEDHHTANFKDEPAGQLGLAVGDRVRLQVYDDDIALDELAGEFDFQITKDMIGREMEKSTSQVTSLKFLVRQR